MQRLAVVHARVARRHGVRGQAELLQHHRLPGHRREFALEGRPVVLADHIGVRAVDVRADEVHVPAVSRSEKPLSRAGHLLAPGAVAERDRLGAARRPHRVAHRTVPTPSPHRTTAGRPGRSARSPASHW